jgi:hypothetical protein
MESGLGVKLGGGQEPDGYPGAAFAHLSSNRFCFALFVEQHQDLRTVIIDEAQKCITAAVHALSVTYR